MKTYLVGGAVRDKQLGIPVKDRDWVVVGATVEEMLAEGYQQVGKDFPVFLHPDSKEEYALARTERKSGKGYTGFEVHANKSVTLEEDLRRRDLTINAMAEEAEGALIDPYGGVKDIEDRILRHVSPAFVEDPLRVVRVARFAARFHHLGFTVAAETLTLMGEISSSGELEALVSERVWTEIHSALREKSPQVFFQVLLECGALQVILPEILAVFGVPQLPKYNPKIDTGIRNFMVVEQAAMLSSDPLVRFAALLQDVAKGAIPESQWPNLHGHEQLGTDLVDPICQRLKAPNEFRDLARLTSLYHTHCHRAASHDAKTLMETLELTDAHRKTERFENFLIACEADARGRLGKENDPYPQADILRSALAASYEVDITAIMAEGFKDADFGIELKKRRIEKIREALQRQ